MFYTHIKHKENSSVYSSTTIPTAVTEINETQLQGAIGSSDWHCISSEPSGQWARPSHTSDLGRHILRSLHIKSPDVQEDKRCQF